MNIIEDFLTNHKRGCLANVGQDCTCGRDEARQELERLRRVESSAYTLFQACSDLCWEDMDKLEKEINEMSQTLVTKKGGLCPECDSEILPSQYCMMGHWCGTPVVEKVSGT